MNKLPFPLILAQDQGLTPDETFALGEKIRIEVARQRVKFNVLRDQSGIGPSTVRQAMAGTRCSNATAWALSRVLFIDLNALLGRDTAGMYTDIAGDQWEIDAQ